MPLITAPYVSRVLGVEGVGTYSYIYSIAYYFGLFGMLGVSNHGNRSIALCKKQKGAVNKKFWNIYVIQLAASFISLSCYVVFICFIFDGNKIIGLIDILLVLSYLLDINWLFFGLEKFKLTVTRNAIVKIITAGCVFLFVKTADDLWIYTLIMTLGMVGSQLFLWMIAIKYLSFPVVSWREIRIHIGPVFALFITVIAYSVYKVMAKIMLGAMTDVSQVGYYENADKIIGIPLGIITAFGTVMMPRISALTAYKDDEKIHEYTVQSFKYFTILVVAMMFGLIGTYEILAPVYFGEEFREAGIIIAGLSVSLIFTTWANIIRTQYLIPNKMDKSYVISMIVGALLNVILNLIFIPLFQARGAMIGTVAAEFSVFLSQLLFVRKVYPVIKYIKGTWPCFFIGLIMSVAVYCIGFFLGESVLTLVLQILSGILIYGIITFLWLYFTKDSLLYSILKKKNDK